MNDRIGAVLATHLPMLCAPTPQKGTEVIGINENPRIHRQSNHLLRGISVKEFFLHLRVAVYLKAEVIQSIEQRYQGVVHAASAGR